MPHIFDRLLAQPQQKSIYNSNINWFDQLDIVRPSNRNLPSNDSNLGFRLDKRPPVLFSLVPPDGFCRASQENGKRSKRERRRHGSINVLLKNHSEKHETNLVANHIKSSKVLFSIVFSLECCPLFSSFNCSSVPAPCPLEVETTSPSVASLWFTKSQGSNMAVGKSPVASKSSFLSHLL